MTIVTTTSQALLCNNYSFFGSKPSLSVSHSQFLKPRHSQASSNAKTWPATTPPPLISSHIRTPACHAARRKPTIAATPSTEEGDDSSRRVLQIILWVAEGVYILWLFLLPYAPVSLSLQKLSEPNCLSTICCRILKSFVSFEMIFPNAL
jgi:hypothetical protein